MKSIFSGFVCRVLAVSMIVLPWQAQAGLIGTDQAMPASGISRSDIAAQLENLGLSPEAARERVAALTDAELTDIAGRVDTMPAGAGGPWGLIIAVAIVFYLAIWVPHFSENANASGKGKTAPPPAEKK